MKNIYDLYTWNGSFQVDGAILGFLECQPDPVKWR